MTLCAAEGCPSFSTRVTSINAAAAAPVTETLRPPVDPALVFFNIGPNYRIQAQPTGYRPNLQDTGHTTGYRHKLQDTGHTTGYRPKTTGYRPTLQDTGPAYRIQAHTT